eukprot:m.10762 g.10762  ORF g.10762 m.10762 type:complete len:323 (-) comp4315_c0_seq1:111-1079(-)
MVTSTQVLESNVGFIKSKNNGKRKIKNKKVHDPWPLKGFDTNTKVALLQNMKLTRLPGTFGNYTNMSELYLSCNKLRELPAEICHLTKLKDLFISNNKLTMLPEDIGRLKCLKTLTASSNELTWLPESIGQLEKLEKLHLGLNKLLLIPDSIGNLKSLLELNLSQNNIKHLPENIGNLSRLCILRLEGNKLWRLPDSIGLLNQLRVLKVKNMKLRSPSQLVLNRGVSSIVGFCRARLCRARWNLEDHVMFGQECNQRLFYVILCASRMAQYTGDWYIPPEIWLVIFSYLRGADIILPVQLQKREKSYLSNQIRHKKSTSTRL